MYIPCIYVIHSLNVVKLSNALEILAYCLYDGKVDQKSEFETELYNDLLSKVRDQLLYELGFISMRSLFQVKLEC